MKFGLLITSVSNFGIKGFYNAQEIGLAKALSEYANKVEVYKLVDLQSNEESYELEGYKNIRVCLIPAKHFGINGFPNVDAFSTDLDCILHFSDTQFSVPTVYGWAKKNNIAYIPYIGVLESHSTSVIKKIITNFMFKRNVSIYKRLSCFVKTPTVGRQLKTLGVNRVSVMPVGLDLDLLHSDYLNTPKCDLLEKYKYNQNDKIILFIGRMIAEKEPLLMLEILKQLHREDTAYKLLMVGTGPLDDAVSNYIKENALEEIVTVLPKVPNSEIWELYRLADAFVNLNKQEIFGMAILEALFYDCKVVAWKAPGPELIIADGVGIIGDDVSSIVKGIKETQIKSNVAHNHILRNYTWKITAAKMYAEAETIVGRKK
ncbi:glycosyltransferase [Ruminococcus sp. 5_1_39BFAA]|uniref:glycosyltransferase n=1 Tax=Ruminococcus sp. 5_1_39BFAA TaxID=457412 RepID=UPI003564C7B3